LSRWICVSTNPGQTSRPSSLISSVSAEMRGSIAAIRPLLMPMSNGVSPRPATRAWRKTRWRAMLLRSLGVTEISGLEFRIAGERRRLPSAHDAARLKDVAAVGNCQSKRGHLIDQQDRSSLVAQLGKNVEQLADDRRRKTERRLIEQQDLRLCHQC